MTNRMRGLLLSVAFAPCLLAAAADEPVHSVGVVEILANPSRFSELRIRVYGVLTIRRGESALYLSRDDARHAIGVNAVGLELGPESRFLTAHGRSSSPAKLNGRFVSVTGDFDASGVVAIKKYRFVLRKVGDIVEQEDHPIR